jgi:hypothetical protein
MMCAGTALAVQIDGRIDPDEWQEARHVTDFRQVQPLNGEPATLATEAWILATADGLAVAFRNVHPDTVPRTLQRVQRDFDEQVDRVNVMLDFDGDHRTGYDFTVSSTDGIADAIITNENSFNDDWDGNWRHAVSADTAGWSVEVLIPWHIAPMRNATGKRTLGVYLDRVTGATGERAGWPLASFERPRFLSDFAQIEVPAYHQALLAITPYASALRDIAGHGGSADAGVDVFWKHNGQLQLTATVNPDFGQVESDDLVVNFDAEETFFSDKRPFFTENQGLFEFTTPSDYSQLLYTRRVGGPADDGSGLGDIIAALKLNGSVGSAKYGVFAAEEDEAVGRSFQAVRLVRDFSRQNLGFMATRTARPYLDRVATVAGIDHDWKPTARWNIRSRLFGSDIDDGANRGTRDVGGTLWADYEMDRGWRQQWIAMYFGDELEINDAGYLSRNNLEYLHWQLNRRFTELPADSRYASKDWRWRVSTIHSATGQRLNNQFRMSRESRLRNGSYEYGQINVNSAGIDDLILRGNGFVNRPPNFNSYFEYDRPRKGDWGFHGEIEISSGGIEGNEHLGYWVELTPKYFINDAFNLYLGLTSSSNPDWLVWQRENLLGSFRRSNAEISAGFNWTLTHRQELRLKLQAIGLDAELRQAYRIDAAGNALETSEPVPDFTVRNLGVQLRYRFEIAPLSYLYVVYGRGGFRNEPRGDDSVGLLGDSFSLRDDEQLLVKFSYRFEM